MSLKVNLGFVASGTRSALEAIAEAIGITEQNLSILKTGKAKATRFSILEAICKFLKCQPGDLLVFEE